jgi:hypothetical protein
MKLTEVFSNEIARAEANIDKKFIKVTWLEHISGAPLQEVLREVLHYAQAEEIHCWLFDLRKLNYTTIADQNWTAKDYFTAFDHRLDHKIACVVSPEKMDMLPDSLIQDAIQRHFVMSTSIEMKIFSNMELAEQWLDL